MKVVKSVTENAWHEKERNVKGYTSETFASIFKSNSSELDLIIQDFN